MTEFAAAKQIGSEPIPTAERAMTSRVAEDLNEQVRAAIDDLRTVARREPG